MEQQSGQATDDEAAKRSKQFKSVINGKGPFSIGYGYVRFRGHKVDAAEVAGFSISKGAGAGVIVAILAFALSAIFLRTGITFFDHLVTGLLGGNAFLFFINYVRPGGPRLLVMHMTDGRKLYAYVSSYTTEPLIRYWEDVAQIAPDMLGRSSK